MGSPSQKQYLIVSSPECKMSDPVPLALSVPLLQAKSLSDILKAVLGL